MNERLMTNAFKNAGIAMLVVSSEGKIAACNPAANKLFRHGDEGLLGFHVSDVLPVASSTELDAYIVPPATEYVVRGMTGRDKKGHPVVLSVHITLSTDPGHGMLHILTLRDIADELEVKRLANDELMLSNNAVQGARIGVFEYDPVSDTVITSDIWREMLGLNPSDTMDVQQEWRERVHPADLRFAMEPVRLCLQNTTERASCEYRLRSRDGQQWRWLQTDIAVAKRNEAGEVIRLIGAQTDITERKKIENELRRSVEQFKSAFNNAPIGMAIVGLDGAWLGVNPALSELFGYSEQELLRTDFQTLTHPDDLDGDLFRLDQLKAGKIPAYQMEKRYIRKNGAVMWGLLSVGMVKDADGNPEHFLSQIVDITEQRRLSELKSEFVATVSHELRTPLTSILGSLALLSSLDTELLSDQAKRLLFIAQQNGDRLHHLVNDILDFEKFTNRHMLFNSSRQGIVGLVDESLLANLASADRFGVRFDMTYSDRHLSAFVDPKRFQQVMGNLMSNAAKFAATGSTIDVVVKRESTAIRVSVSNIGEGIPNSFRDKVFRPFSQAAPASTRKRSGTGLGLSISKQIVEQMGGEIGFESIKGEKTTFWFTLPTDAPT